MQWSNWFALLSEILIKEFCSFQSLVEESLRETFSL